MSRTEALRRGDYDIRPDGQRFLIGRVLEGGTSQPVNVCLNWLAGKK